MLVDLSWSVKASCRMLVAKLYSGYMGASGALQLEREDLTPGAVPTQPPELSRFLIECLKAHDVPALVFALTRGLYVGICPVNDPIHLGQIVL